VFRIFIYFIETSTLCLPLWEIGISVIYLCRTRKGKPAKTLTAKFSHGTLFSPNSRQPEPLQNKKVKIKNVTRLEFLVVNRRKKSVNNSDIGNFDTTLYRLMTPS
jgi:hypothetical protein